MQTLGYPYGLWLLISGDTIEEVYQGGEVSPAGTCRSGEINQQFSSAGHPVR